jgi:hypothetical protein
MRFFKKHYFLMPPFEAADLARLGLKIPDPHPSPVPKPENQVEAYSKCLRHFELGVCAERKLHTINQCA